MKIEILTLFPEMFGEVFGVSMLGRAIENGTLEIDIHNIRDYSTDKHKKTDDYPFGGGAGMLLMPQPIFDALQNLGTEGKRLIYMSPRGHILDGERIAGLAKEENIVILCGHYEGLDQRVIDRFGFEEVSVGDYILTGGELPAMMLTDAVCRLLPGVLGNASAHDEESVYSGLLEYPQYTRPAVYRDDSAEGGIDLAVPEVLTSGNHKEIHLWNFRKSLELTAERRPDLLKKFIELHENEAALPEAKRLTKPERKILTEVADRFNAGTKSL